MTKGKQTIYLRKHMSCLIMVKSWRIRRVHIGNTKYEFGKNKNGDIILIDEFTCDSSDILKSTYLERFNSKQEPEKLDKDSVRDWVKSVCDPYKDNIPEIPSNIIEKAYNSYSYFYNTLYQVDAFEQTNHWL